MIAAATSKYVSASIPASRTTADHVQAESVPSEISVSIVAARWRRLSAAARWNGQPPQNTTGVASASASHSQPRNWSGGAIASSGERGGEDGGDDEARAPGAARILARDGVGRERGVVAGGLDRGEQVVEPARSSGSKLTVASSVA